MPFYLHRIGESVETGLEYATRKEALAERVDGLTVGYVATETERADWMAREREQFANGRYVAVPWQYEDFARSAPCVDHFAHLSINEKGLIAYTPTDEYGIENRQLRIKPGKYLNQFSKGELSQRQIDAYCAQIANVDSTYHLATSQTDIRSIYVNGPSSCMGGYGKTSDHFSLSDRYHPVDAYAESDLALAYMGTVESPTARCIVWPEKKVLTRCYGANNGHSGQTGDVLRALLRKDGYVDAYHGDASGLMDGARIRAICVDRDRESYLMPYIDAAESASLAHDRKHFILHDDSKGHFSTKRTEGQTEDIERSTCANCGDECDDDETYCSSCNDDRWSCESCGAEGFDPSDNVYVNDTTYCDSCASDIRSTCELCDHSWYTIRSSYGTDRRRYRRFNENGEQQLSAAELDVLVGRHVDHLCVDCAETHDHCATCDDLTSHDDLTDLPNGDRVCADCVPEPEPDSDDDTPIEAIRTCACDSCRVQS